MTDADRLPTRRASTRTNSIGVGLAVAYLSLIVLIPIAALTWAGVAQGPRSFWDSITAPESLAALILTIWIAAIVVVVNAVMGTLIAWMLIRVRFPGRAIVDALIDLPFALPTIVAGLTLLALYGPNSPFGVNIAYTRIGIIAALLLVTLPFVVRAVQPLLREADAEAEEAAASLGAGPATVFRRITFPAIYAGILGGSGLAFARALGEFGAVVLIAGNLPFETKMASVDIFGLIESDRTDDAAAVSLALLVLSLASLALFDLLVRRQQRHHA
jgi:sulfate transport system permease protein